MKPDSTPHQYSPRQNRMKARTHRSRADHRHHVGRQPGPRRPARQVEGGLAPQVQRQDIGHALVGGVIGGAFDRFRVGRVERQNERPVALAQFGVAQLGRLGCEHFIAFDRCAAFEGRDHGGSVFAGRHMRHHRLSAERQHGPRPAAHCLQPRRVPGIVHAGERAPGARSASSAHSNPALVARRHARSRASIPNGRAGLMPIGTNVIRSGSLMASGIMADSGPWKAG